MRLPYSNSTLFALSYLFCLGSSLPFEPRRMALAEPVVRRATYSVVAVDGGSSAAAGGGSPPAAVTVVETVLKTQEPATKTIVSTDAATPLAVTDHVYSTKTIEGLDTTHTVLVTVTPPPSATTITAVGYSVINVNSPTVAVPPIALSHTISSSTLSSSTSISDSAPTSSSSSVEFSSSTATATDTLEPVSLTPTPTTTSYDDGLWHTTYPPWSDSTGTPTAVVEIVQATSLILDPIPKLQATAVGVVPADSVPSLNAEEMADSVFGGKDFQF